MQRYLLMCCIILISDSVFSQLDNISLATCISSAISNHKLNSRKEIIDEMLALNNRIADISSYPTLNWNSMARIQSESFGLEFDNPMLPSVEIPLYSIYSVVETNYMIYDGGLRKKLRTTNSSDAAVQRQQTEIEIEEVKKQIVNVYINILLLQESLKELQLGLIRLNDNKSLVEALFRHGVTDKSEVLRWKAMELQLLGKIESTRKDKTGMIRILEKLCHIGIDDNCIFETPEFSEDIFLSTSQRKEIALLEIKKHDLQNKSLLLEVQNMPKVFIFANAGIGYPNPLNFFSEKLSPYALAGVGVNWKIHDWGKSKHEKAIIRLQSSVLENQKEYLEEVFSQQDEKFLTMKEKYDSLIDRQSEIIKIYEEIAEIQGSKLRNGTILPVEHLRSLNDITEARLRMSQYKLGLLKEKTEFLIIKGKI